ncbi:MAG: hypothetical protein AAGF26_06165 [Cyanobacteria bacterium P01_G01_bin.49]
MLSKAYSLVLATISLVVPVRTSLAATIFTESFDTVFESPFVSGLTDSGTISYTLEAEDLDSDGILDPDDLTSELISLTLTSNDFSTPELNFNLSFEMGDNLDIFNTITDVINPFFDFSNEQLSVILTTQMLEVEPVRVIVVDELGLIAQTGDFPTLNSGLVGLGFDFDGNGIIEAEESVIAPTSVPESSTILSSLVLLGLFFIVKLKKFEV